jgi:hypothetical protein
MNTALLSLALAALVGTSPAPLPFGGWASISVEKVPDQVVTGKAFDLVFVVKQHGKSPLSGLKPTLEIKGGSPVDRIAAEPGKEKGQYKATVVLSTVGSYFITIHSGFADSRVTLPAINAVAVATQGGTR